MSDHEITEAMLTFGGNFMRQLALTFRAADSRNQQRIKDAFANEWQQYRELAIMRAEQPRRTMAEQWAEEDEERHNEGG